MFISSGFFFDPVQCLGEGMTLKEIKNTYTEIPQEAVNEIMLLAADGLEKINVAS